jgi:predicted nucleic acid-binding protein
MKEACVDANVFIASLVEPPVDHPCRRLMERFEHEGTVLFEPALVVFEVCSVLHRKCQQREISQRCMEQAQALFFRLPMMLLWQEPFMHHVAQVGRALSASMIYDAAYLGSAQERKVPLITNDMHLYRKGKTLYPKVFTVQQALRAFKR